ncbi:PHD-finger domain-containing protein [Phthorimaea operculella]|nr:PHD-finger domain-containing protein [Phthorimaea operculella]
MRNCVECKKHINVMELLVCTKCKGNFHYQCVGIALNDYKGQKEELDLNWICPGCTGITKRLPRGDLTPASPASSIMNDSFMSSISVDDYENNDQNIPGDTLIDKTIQFPPVKSFIANITLEQISALLDEKLQNINYTITHKLCKSIDKLELDFADLRKKLLEQQQLFRSQIDQIDLKIKTLEAENIRAKIELAELQKKLEIKPYTQHQTSPVVGHEMKKIVLYGLDEYEWESEYELHDRVVGIFSSILPVNLTGYIEEMTRLGKRGHRRPLVIELLSKNMTKYLLDNQHYFRNTGFNISEFLNEEATKNEENYKK